MGLIIVLHRVVWVWWADACYVLDPLLCRAGSVQEGPAPRSGSRELWWDMCVLPGWRGRLAQLNPSHLSHQAPGYTGPEAQGCAHPQLGEGSWRAGDVALSECEPADETLEGHSARYWERSCAGVSRQRGSPDSWKVPA